MTEIQMLLMKPLSALHNILKVAIPCLISFSINAQTFNASNINLSQQHVPWIQSANDFNQENLTSAQIDLEISHIIKTAALNQVLTKDIETPINTKKLIYLGYKHPNNLNIFKQNPISSNNSSNINKTLHIYKYDQFYFSTETNSATDQTHIFYSIRAIEILKNRYTEAFQMLFTNTTFYQTDRPKFETFANANKAFWIAFNTHPIYIAESLTTFLQEGYFPNTDGVLVARYANIPVISIHSENILGTNNTKGSKPIYNKPTAQENYKLYMREALVETILHEMLHQYIDYAYPYNETISKIKHSRNLYAFNLAEECATMNTSLSYLMRKGGFSNTLFDYYYPTVFNYNITTLKNKNLLDSYRAIFNNSSAFSNKNLRDIFNLHLFDSH